MKGLNIPIKDVLLLEKVNDYKRKARIIYMERNKLEYYITRYGKDIYSFCTYLTKNKQEADDLYQDTFLRAIEKDELDDEQNPKSYFIAISINIWNNKKRKFLWRKKKVDVITLYEESDLEQVPDSFNIENQVIRKQELEEVVRLVSELPDKYRLVVLMYYMEEMSLDDISVILNIPVGTIKSRLYYARQLLKEKMEM